ncbi:AMP-binding protein [bacterium]|nr:AMP-binding protein [bacterium]
MKTNFGRAMKLFSKHFSDKEALVNTERNRRYTFSELHLLTNKIANMIRLDFNLRRGDCFVNILENDNLSLLHLWTIFKGEAVGAFSNIRDSINIHLQQIDQAEPKLVFIENYLLDNYYEPLRKRGIEIVCMDTISDARDGVHYFWDHVDKASDEEVDVEHDMEKDVVLFRFTGGTTGQGKCAEYTLGNWYGARLMCYSHPERVFSPDTRFLHIAPISHASGLFINPTVFQGGCTLTLNIPDMVKFCEVIETEKINLTLLIPILCYRLLEEDIGQYDLSSLETILYGASPMNPGNLEQLQEKFGNIFVQGYAATECVAPISILSHADHIVKTEEDKKRLGSAGRVVPGMEIKVVDQDGNELPNGEIGEICVRSSAVIRGYFKNPKDTKKEFFDGWWKSGDLGYLDEEGYIFLHDRKKDMIISGGFNVYAVEVENVINMHPDVASSAIIGIPHDEWGESVHAEVILKAGKCLTENDLINYVKGKIGSYKSPKTVKFVDILPFSVVGKLLRRQVREKYWAGKERQIN